MGSESEILARKNNPLFFRMFIIGALLIMGLYHVGLYALRRKERSPLYFGLYSLSGMLAALGMEGQLISVLFPALDWEAAFRVTSAGVYSSVAIFVLFIHSLFPDTGHKLLTQAFTALAAAFVLTTIITPVYIHSYALSAYIQVVMTAASIYIFYMLVRAAILKKESASLALGGGMVLPVCVTYDALQSGDLNQSGYLTDLGNLAFICTLAFILAMRFSRAFSTVERQEAELEEANIYLEKRVEERTASLNRSMQEKEALLREIHTG